jgi:hypothetical protein
MDEWWRLLGSSLPRSILPELGFAVRDDELLCGCFVCEMELAGGLGELISHTSTNPNRQHAAMRAVNQMLEEIRVYAVQNGFIALMGMTSSRLLAKTYTDNNFQQGDTGLTQYILV